MGAQGATKPTWSARVAGFEPIACASEKSSHSAKIIADVGRPDLERTEHGSVELLGGGAVRHPDGHVIEHARPS